MFRPDAPPAALRERLFARVAQSAAAARVMHTVRFGAFAPDRPAPGVALHTLYRAAPGRRRAGEPAWSALVRLEAGACWSPAPTPQAREWLVLHGAIELDGMPLGVHDFHRATGTQGVVSCDRGALLLLREGEALGEPAAHTQRAADAPWHDFAPLIQRRVLWQAQGQAAMLYRTQAEAAVPRHAHQHDEECLMLQGDLFLDDVLLRPLDYQLAPAGSGHAQVFTDTGVLLYAHGDVELALCDA